MIQSESRTWTAFVAGAKSVTRRVWLPSTAAWYQAGKVFDAYDQMPYAGGVRIGRARVTRDAYREHLRDCPDSDYEAEGFAWMNEHPAAIPPAARSQVWAQANCAPFAFELWRRQAGRVYVVRFEIVEIEDDAVRRLQELLEPKEVRA
jgi:hypothetical protein